ncbi:hypothetical protein V6N13_003412 [Hibiscus sabdariffa]|uniref:RNase H type-1 domain-containing protein n=2 Tax=Hibiscus sabdariffa TaxID=183260 RepID=A0ABR2AGD0_9ROSI
MAKHSSTVPSGACSKDGLYGVEGVLRDSNGLILLDFSHSIGAGSVLLAELLAVKHAVEIFVKSLWAKRFRLIVESDSKCAVEWISSPLVVDPLFCKVVEDISSFFVEGRWFIRYIRREQNVSVDILAKSGIG